MLHIDVPCGLCSSMFYSIYVTSHKIIFLPPNAPVMGSEKSSFPGYPENLHTICCTVYLENIQLIYMLLESSVLGWVVPVFYIR